MQTEKTYEVVRSDEEWRRMLTPEQYEVMRRQGTEAPGSCALLREDRSGLFSCAGCGPPALQVNRQIRKRDGLAEFSTTPCPDRSKRR